MASLNQDATKMTLSTARNAIFFTCVTCRPTHSPIKKIAFKMCVHKTELSTVAKSRQNGAIPLPSNHSAEILDFKIQQKTRETTTKKRFKCIKLPIEELQRDVRMIALPILMAKLSTESTSSVLPPRYSHRSGWIGLC